MNRKLTRDLSANALQLILNQLFGLVIFYVLSTGLNKTGFGQLNLALAILLAAFNILSLGIDQLIVKKIAFGNDLHKTLWLYVCHVLFTGSLFYGLLFTGWMLFPQATNTYTILLLIGIGKLMVYFSTPFKQVANGLERFKLLAWMSIGSNLVRAIALLAFGLLHMVTLHVIVLIFICGDAAELFACVVIYRYNIGSLLPFTWDKLHYKSTLRESLPQTGVVVITSALARFDWIFIGTFLSAIKLAEYSFAYKVFEISTFPLLSIAPLLIPRFTKLFQNGGNATKNLSLLIRVEIIIALLVAIVLNVCWTPVIDAVTAGKYGAVNRYVVLILSGCMPLLYVNNFLWTIYFAKGMLKMILMAFVVTLIVNVVGDVVLIPLCKNEGAAAAFLLACLAQTIFFLKKNDIKILNAIPLTLMICTACALCTGFLVNYFTINVWIALPVSLLIYVALLMLTRQLQLNDRKQLAELLHF